MNIDKVPINEFVLSVLNRDEVRTILNNWDLELEWVSKIVGEHYRGMGMFLVPKIQHSHMIKDVMAHLEINLDIRREVARKQTIRNKQRVRGSVDE
jgi:hypothetical protein